MLDQERQLDDDSESIDNHELDSIHFTSADLESPPLPEPERISSTEEVARQGVFENCQRNKDVRALSEGGGLFVTLGATHGEPPINTSFENIEQQKDVYEAIEQFGKENQMSLVDLDADQTSPFAAFRATYANAIADRIYNVVPYGRIYFRFIMAFYVVSRFNINRLYLMKGFNVVVAIAASLGIFAVFMTTGGESVPIWMSVAQGGILVYFWSTSTFFFSLFESRRQVNKATMARKVTERLYHILNAEQAVMGRIITDENEGFGDKEWRNRAAVWALAATAFRWRIFLLKQFVDVALHKVVRRYLWVHNFLFPLVFVPLIMLGSLSGMAMFAGLGASDLATVCHFCEWLEYLPHRLVLGHVLLTIAVLITAHRFWSANPTETINELAAEIRNLDRNSNNDTMLSTVVNLVGRVANAKMENR